MGIDHYLENEASLNWDKEFNLSLNTLSIKDWINKLRSQGYMIYVNKTSSGTSYRMGEPTQAIINAGVGAVLMNGKADKTIIAAGIKALYGTGVSFAS